MDQSTATNGSIGISNAATAHRLRDNDKQEQCMRDNFHNAQY
jgi:hypothetical protein